MRSIRLLLRPSPRKKSAQPSRLSRIWLLASLPLLTTCAGGLVRPLETCLMDDTGVMECVSAKGEPFTLTPACVQIEGEYEVRYHDVILPFVCRPAPEDRALLEACHAQ